MASTDAKPVPQKNVAYRVTFPILDSDGDLVTGATSPDSEVSKDGGTFADCTNEATEIATSSGMYYLDLTSTEMNADTVAIIVKSGNGKTTSLVLYPEEAGDIRVNVTQIGSSNVTSASGIPEVKVASFANDAITASAIADNAIDAGAIASDAITSAKIATDAIGSAQIAATAVTEIQSGLSTLDAAGKAGGGAGKVGEVVNKVGNVIDPINAVGAGVKAGGKVAAEVVGGLGTHTGGQSLVSAAKAGAEGGEAGEAFRAQIRGTRPIDEVVTDAKAAVTALREERGKVYRDEMAKIGQDSTVLDFAKVDQAIADTQKVKTYKGQDLSPTTKEIRTQIAKEVDDWKKLDPKEFHTAEGLDALKQKIGDIRDGAKHGTPERIVADKAYQSVRQTIIDQAPKYADIMKGYEQASDLLRQVESTLSLNPKANVDTAVRKLQSVLRNNVNTNYGKRAELAEFLVAAGAEHLLTKLAGQALSAWTPRGLGKLVAGGATMATAAGALGGLPTLAVAGGVLPFTSPRFMGEAAHLAGRASRIGPEAGRTMFQAGRETRVSR